ncbi:hypothetical protein C8Q73DRAFT_423617 [Cubamyces lactineus]|nr:hypothetical protein C8Q73DRAFT_423617 [Cubamyces lactineus]
MCHEEAAASTQPNLVCTFAHCLSPSPSPLSITSPHTYSSALPTPSPLRDLRYSPYHYFILTIVLFSLGSSSFGALIVPAYSASTTNLRVWHVFASARLNLRLGHACLLILLFSSPTSCLREHSYLSVRSSDLPLRVVRTCTRTYLIFRTGAYAVLERAPSHGPFLTSPLAWGSLTFMAPSGFLFVSTASLRFSLFKEWDRLHSWSTFLCLLNSSSSSSSSLKASTLFLYSSHTLSLCFSLSSFCSQAP